jgi:hypothetical protein
VTVQTGAITAVSAAADVLIFILAPVSHICKLVKNEVTELKALGRKPLCMLLRLIEAGADLFRCAGISSGILLSRSFIRILS